MIKIRLVVVLLFFVSKSTFSQSNENTVHQSIEWFSLNSTIKVHQRVGIFVEGNFRFVQTLNPQQYQFRTAVDITLSKNFSIVPVGYVYSWNFQYGKQPVSYVNNEHRLYQQVMYKHAIGRFYFHHRFRLEERFLQDHHTSAEGVVIGDAYTNERNRIRYRPLVYIPLNHNKIEAKTVFISVWDEVFASWGKDVTYHSPDQNRLFVGAGYQFTKLISVQAGGLYQMLKKSNGALQENNVGMLILLTYNLDLTKQAGN